MPPKSPRERAKSLRECPGRPASTLPGSILRYLSGSLAAISRLFRDGLQKSTGMDYFNYSIIFCAGLDITQSLFHARSRRFLAPFLPSRAALRFALRRPALGCNAPRSLLWQPAFPSPTHPPRPIPARSPCPTPALTCQYRISSCPSPLSQHSSSNLCMLAPAASPEPA